MICPLCDEEIVGKDTLALGTPEGPGQAHRVCMLREVTGGIGHLIAHEYWCSQHGDPDAGLTKYQSARLVDTYYSVGGPSVSPPFSD